MMNNEPSQHLDRVSSMSSSTNESEISATSSAGTSTSGRGTQEDDTQRIIRVSGPISVGARDSLNLGVNPRKSTSFSNKRTVGDNRPDEWPKHKQSTGRQPQRPAMSGQQNAASHKSQQAGDNIAHKSNTKRNNITNSTTRHLLILILFIIGLIVCVSSILCLLLLPSFVTQQIAKKLVLKNNSMLLERWSRPNVPMYFKVWLYDIQNAQEILDKRDTKPRVAEIGPFVFNLRRQKDVISFAGDNLYYTERKIYHFNRELSCCAINTTVTIPNIPLVAVVDRALGYNLPLVGRFIPRLINRAIQSLREQLFVRKQVGEILFDGYDVELLRMVSRVGSLVGLPQQSQRFALLKGRNDTWRPEQDGVWAINTGQRDRRQFGRVSSWNSYKRLPFWAEPACNAINGSDGTLFPPPIKRTEPLYIFNQELCRTVNLIFDRPSDVRSIKSLRFVLNPLNFAHTMTPSLSGTSSSSSSISARQSTGSNSAAAAAVRGVQQLLLANQTAQALVQASRTRINPIFQNRDRLAPASNGARPTSDPVDPISILGIVAPQPPYPPPVQLLQPATPAQHQVGVSTETNKPQLRVGVSRPPAGSRRVVSAGPTISSTLRAQNDDAIRPSASEDRSSRAQGVTLGNLLDGDHKSQVEKAQGVAAKLVAEDKIRREQEKLIQVAQEAQLVKERKSRINPQTCFCDRKQTNLNGVNVCELDGLIDLSKCSKQAQVIFGSMPHFHNSDPRLLRQVIGLTPNASKHTTYLDIEPNTGLVLGGKRRVQLNVIIKHNNEIDGFENINDMLVPIVWFEESAMITEETAQKFRSMYVDRIRLVNYILLSLLIASIVLLAVDARLLLTTHGFRRQFAQWRLAGEPNERTTRSQQQVVNDDEMSGSIKGRSSSTTTTTPTSLQRLHANQLNGRGGRADSPLLHNSRSSLNSTPDSSPPVTPAGSPALRKWSHTTGAVQVAASVAKRAGTTTTRVYLNGGTGAAPDQQAATTPGGDVQ